MRVAFIAGPDALPGTQKMTLHMDDVAPELFDDWIAIKGRHAQGRIS